MRTRPSPRLPLALALGLAVAARAPRRSTRAEAETRGGFAPAAETARGFGARRPARAQPGRDGRRALLLPQERRRLAAPARARRRLLPRAARLRRRRRRLRATPAAAGTARTASGSDSFALAARAGYAFAFNDRFGVWPLGGLAVDHAVGEPRVRRRTPGSRSSCPSSSTRRRTSSWALGPSFQLHLVGPGAQRVRHRFDARRLVLAMAARPRPLAPHHRGRSWSRRRSRSPVTRSCAASASSAASRCARAPSSGTSWRACRSSWAATSPSTRSSASTRAGDALELCLRHAAALGANAVVGMRYDANEIAAGVTEVLAYGTAVAVTPSS